MMKLNNRERKMVIGAGSFLAAVTIYLVLIGPFLSSKDVLDEKLESSYSLLRDYNAMLSDEAEYQEGLQSRR